MKQSVLLGVGLWLTIAHGGSAQRGGAANFVPAVVLRDTLASCEAQPAAILSDDEKGYVLRFGSGGTTSRLVSAVWDTSGHLRRYSDARGDLRGPTVASADLGARTSIVIDLVKGIALLMNESHGRSSGAALTTPAEALVAEHLGPPKRLLERLHTQCGAPAP
jgi:hypothetical protein